MIGQCILLELGHLNNTWIIIAYLDHLVNFILELSLIILSRSEDGESLEVVGDIKSYINGHSESSSNV